MQETEERRPTQEEAPGALVDLLTVEELDKDLYRGKRNPGGQGRVFGGQVIAQALMSAVGSVDEDRVAHSVHAMLPDEVTNVLLTFFLQELLETVRTEVVEELDDILLFDLLAHVSTRDVEIHTDV